MSKIVISGANGAVGRALCAGLAHRSECIVPLVRRPTGLVYEQVAGREDTLRVALKDCTTLIHLAGMSGPRGRPASAGQSSIWDSNVTLTRTLGRIAVESGVKRILFMSSIKVNGENTQTSRPFKPTDKPKPSCIYGLSKLAAEQNLTRLCSGTDAKALIIRPTVIYGPGIGGNVLALGRWIKRGRPLPRPSCTNRRAVLAVENLVSFIEACIDFDLSDIKNGAIFLVSDGDDISSEELVMRLSNACGRKPRFIPGAGKLIALGSDKIDFLYGVRQRLWGSLGVDITQTCETLGWKPSTSMERQLKLMALADAFS